MPNSGRKWQCPEPARKIAYPGSTVRKRLPLMDVSSSEGVWQGPDHVPALGPGAPEAITSFVANPPDLPAIPARVSLLPSSIPRRGSSVTSPNDKFMRGYRGCVSTCKKNSGDPPRLRPLRARRESSLHGSWWSGRRNPSLRDQPRRWNTFQPTNICRRASSDTGSLSDPRRPSNFPSRSPLPLTPHILTQGRPCPRSGPSRLRDRDTGVTRVLLLGMRVERSEDVGDLKV